MKKRKAFKAKAKIRPTWQRQRRKPATMPGRVIFSWQCQKCGWMNDNNNGPCRKCGAAT